jgi:hypothetical protein
MSTPVIHSDEHGLQVRDLIAILSELDPSLRTNISELENVTACRFNPVWLSHVYSCLPDHLEEQYRAARHKCDAARNELTKSRSDLRSLLDRADRARAIMRRIKHLKAQRIRLP